MNISDRLNELMLSYRREARRCLRAKSYLAATVMQVSAFEAGLQAMCFLYPDEVKRTSVYTNKHFAAHATGRWNPPCINSSTSPPSQGAASIGGGGDAAAFALAVRENLTQFLKKHGLRKTRLFFYGPYALSVFVGQQLTSVGEIQVFEYQDPSYVPSCTLRT